MTIEDHLTAADIVQSLTGKVAEPPAGYQERRSLPREYCPESETRPERKYNRQFAESGTFAVPPERERLFSSTSRSCYRGAAISRLMLRPGTADGGTPQDANSAAAKGTHAKAKKLRFTPTP